MSGTMATGVFIGRLTRDAETKFTGAGLAICHFSIATDARIKKGDQWVDEASFWDVDIFGKTAENLGQYLTKGKPVAVAGPVRIETWEKDGTKHQKVKINADSVTLLGSKEGQGEARQGSDERRPAVSTGRVLPAGYDASNEVPF